MVVKPDVLFNKIEDVKNYKDYINQQLELAVETKGFDIDKPIAIEIPKPKSIGMLMFIISLYKVRNEYGYYWSVTHNYENSNDVTTLIFFWRRLQS